MAVSPRFAITSSPGADGNGPAALMRQHPGLQHADAICRRTAAEIDLACSLYPEARDYADIYSR